MDGFSEGGSLPDFILSTCIVSEVTKVLGAHAILFWLPSCDGSIPIGSHSPFPIVSEGMAMGGANRVVCGLRKGGSELGMVWVVAVQTQLSSR